MISDSDLQQIMPKLSADKRDLYLPYLNHAMSDFEINTPLRAAAFLGQLAHESGELRFMEEIWGPTAQQLRYEPPSSLATKLGNTEPGDGKRYKGRGPIQITGRANYRRYGQMLDEDLENNPDLAATPQVAFSIAGIYWQSNGLNELADIPDFIEITRRINGALNGLPDRQKYYEIAKQVLGVSVSRGAATPAVRAAAAPAPPKLERGFEAITASADDPTPPATRPASESKKKSAVAPARPAAKKVSAKKPTKR